MTNHMRETPFNKADALADILVDVVTYHINEIAEDEPQYVRDKALRMMARRVLKEIPNITNV